PASAAAGASQAGSAVAAAPESTRPRPVDAELSFAARRLHADGMPWLQGGRVDASLVDGRLTVSHFDVGIGPGRAVGKASVDTASTPLRGDAEVDVSAIRVESFLPPQAAKAMLTGTLRGRAVLKASGDSAETLLASAAGTVSAFVSAGTISSLLDAKMGLQGGRVVRSLLAGAEPIALRCAAAVLDLDHGAGRIRSLVIDTERTRTIGSGTVDLAKEAFDVVLTPEAKQPGLFILERSIHLHGALHEATHELVARVPVASAPVRGCRDERP
ncbi:MAG: AsmA family protein, partial [Pseudomonadota bacterium]|nr:AsmA family protein [Pseudomonadota bacterium]